MSNSIRNHSFIKATILGLMDTGSTLESVAKTIFVVFMLEGVEEGHDNPTEYARETCYRIFSDLELNFTMPNLA